MQNRTLLPHRVLTCDGVDETACERGPERFSLSRLFSDDMVVQRGRRNQVWGTASPGDLVTVEIGGAQYSASAGADGKWHTDTEPLPPGGPYTMTVCCGRQTRTVDGILSGDVWVCAGQSNMEWPVHYVLDSERVIASADHPDIRCFAVYQRANAVPLDTLSPCDRWHRASPVTVRWFSAVGYFFAQALNRELGVPIGLIDNSYGGTCAEAWTRAEAMRTRKELDPVFARHAAQMDETAYTERVATWCRDVEEWNAIPEPEQQQWLTMLKWWRRIRPPYGHPRCSDSPGGLFNGMVYPLIPYGIKGVLWYQGESNVDRAGEYRTLLPTLIADWRAAWGQGAFPFLVVQLANVSPPPAQPEASAWAELREAQLMTARTTPGVGLAVTIDVGDREQGHPPNKQPVGHRLALAALALAYGRAIVASGPTYERMAIEGDRVRLFFSDLGGGLVAKGGPLHHFAIAGDDRNFVWAAAWIEGDTIVVSSPSVRTPAAVRYAWSTNPEGCNLYNAAGLLASPFRTDAWPTGPGE